jgi:hypothetical protein
VFYHSARTGRAFLAATEPVVMPSGVVALQPQGELGDQILPALRFGEEVVGEVDQWLIGR